MMLSEKLIEVAFYLQLEARVLETKASATAVHMSLTFLLKDVVTTDQLRLEAAELNRRSVILRDYCRAVNEAALQVTGDSK